jgi:hypothetical protein
MVEKSDLKAVSRRVLPYMKTFCAELFPEGMISPRGGYWEVSGVTFRLRSDDGDLNLKREDIRISLKMGGFYFTELPSIRNPFGNPLTLWMVSRDVVLNYQLECLSASDLERSVRELNGWCDEVERGPLEDSNYVDPERDYEFAMGRKELIRDCIADEPRKRRSAKQIWNLINQKTNGACKKIPGLRSHYQLFSLLEEWAQESASFTARQKYIGVLGPPREPPDFFAVEKHSRSKVTTFTLSASE